LDTFGVGGIDEDGAFVVRCILGLGAAVGFLPSVWWMLGLGRSTMGKALERTVNVAWHDYLAGAWIIVPVERETTITVAILISLGDVATFEGSEQMQRVFLFGIAYVEIVDHEREYDVACTMLP
jgi:hypothetical protein